MAAAKSSIKKLTTTQNPKKLYGRTITMTLFKHIQKINRVDHHVPGSGL
jgi:hypothetical protein